ncbi:MAG: hypothetical protein ACM3H8_09820 [Sphingobacteriales bacterium]
MIFSTQILPIVQIGRVLYQNPLTEELPHSTTSAPAPNSFLEEIHKAYLHNLQNTGIRLHTQVITHRIHETENISTQFIGEVQTPPPNC